MYCSGISLFLYGQECFCFCRDKNGLSRHIRHVHEKVRNYECDICKERFFRSDHLKNHRLRHAEADKKCPFCPRMFKHPDDLLRHTKTHTGRLRCSVSTAMNEMVKHFSAQPATLILYHTVTTFNDSYKKLFENIVRKGENAGNQHFLLFPQCFQPVTK